MAQTNAAGIRAAAGTRPGYERGVSIFLPERHSNCDISHAVQPGEAFARLLESEKRMQQVPDVTEGEREGRG